MSRACRSVNVAPSVTTYCSVLTFVLSIVGSYTSESTPPATVYQTLDPWAAAVPTQSFLARSKYDGAPGAPGAVVAVPAVAAAVAAGVATASPAMRAALATNVVKRRTRTKARPSIVISAAGRKPRLTAGGALQRLGLDLPTGAAAQLSRATGFGVRVAGPRELRHRCRTCRAIPEKVMPPKPLEPGDPLRLGR